MEMNCTNPECMRSWDYRGAKTYPSYVTCPDCHKPLKLPKPEEGEHA